MNICCSETPNLSVIVSILHTYEDIGNRCYDWQVGVHGIIINFKGVMIGSSDSGCS